jgi:propionaldehyde dehydrogenase
MGFSTEEIARIVTRVVDQLEDTPPSFAAGTQSTSSEWVAPNALSGTYPRISTCVERAGIAYEKFRSSKVSEREKIIQAIRKTCMDHVEQLARMAWEETGMGRWKDKLQKNRVVIEKTPGTEDLQPTAYSGDFGLTLQENAAYGVIGSITPTTNPTETIINNSISMIAGGNAVVFNPHPRAKKCCGFTTHLINSAIQSCGGPEDLITIMENPTMESGQELMTHPGIRILVVTGGPGIVKAAFAAGKKVIAAGPGNPPAVVDETADLDEAAKNIIAGATLDNNILCTAEKEILVVDSVGDSFVQALKRHGGYQVIGSNVHRLEQLIYRDGHVNADCIGQDAGVILAQIGIDVPESIRMGFIECDFDHFLVKTEQMMPILPVVRCKDVAEAIDRAIEAEKGNFHTATMHSKNLDALHEMAVRSNVSIFVKNGPQFSGLGMGGEGFCTMTIAGNTGEGLTSARSFTRKRRCVLKGHFRIV